MIYKLQNTTTMNINSEGTFEGYASLFGKKDMGNDIVLPGAFRDCLTRRKTSDIKMLYQHDPGEPLGIWHDIREDHLGLRVKGQLTMNVFRAREVCHLMKSGALDGLSIGFHTVKANRNAKTGIRYLHKIDLWEISIVTFPMLTGARISTVKHSHLASRIRQITSSIQTAIN